MKNLVARVKIDNFTVTIGQPSPEQHERIAGELEAYNAYMKSENKDHHTTWDNCLNTLHWLYADTIKSIKSDDNSFKVEYIGDHLTVSSVTNILAISNKFRNILTLLCGFASRNELSLLQNDDVTRALGMNILSVEPANSHH